MEITGNQYLDNDIWHMVHMMKMKDIIKTIEYSSNMIKPIELHHIGSDNRSRLSNMMNDINMLDDIFDYFQYLRYEELGEINTQYSFRLIGVESDDDDDEDDDVSGGYVDMGQGFSNIKGYHYL
jgi:hypothetical protein